MLRRLMLPFCFAVGLGLLAGPGTATAQEGEVVLLDGETWQQLSPDSKLAFVWGVVHVVEFERQLAKGSWDAEDPSLLPHFVTGLEGKSMNDVVIAVDGYYAADDGRLGHPVMQAIVHTVVLPAL